MRGALADTRFLELRKGIIPADAGSTPRTRQARRFPWDHPRGCGEHSSRCSSIAVLLGSSPRMRGALADAYKDIYYRRIIPAEAGSTSVQSGTGSWTRDHPRGCGEHDSNSFTIIMSMGSSPQMRGALSLAPPLISTSGIIPADAGSTSEFCLAYPIYEDHPRGCGEHETVNSQRLGALGSSPRMRGAPLGIDDNGTPDGIIPADAGSTQKAYTKANSLGDHPRGCGEHFIGIHRRGCIGESSPRMRGARTSAPQPQPSSRIIPADAGSTRCPDACR